MAAPSASLFVNQLAEHQLLQPTQIDEVRRRLKAQFPEARALAAELIRRSWLTPFQVNKLLQGRGEELALGPYRLIERLGAGGMGEVFKARHVRMDRLVALKIIHKQQLASPTAVERFHREARAAAQLAHPNIVIAYDADEVGDTHFLAMEYIDGTDLAARVKNAGPLPIAKACQFIRQAALGLQHAHEKGLVHRDIKPANLLVTAASGDAGEVVKILDFGLARFESANGRAGQLTQVGKFVGTVDYISPEQAENPQAADVRSDLYSLGCCLFYLLTGQPPFAGADAVARLAARLLNAPPSARTLRPEVPVALSQVLMKMMAREPGQRYQTAVAVASALQPFCASGMPPRLLREAPAENSKETRQKSASVVAGVRSVTAPTKEKSVEPVKAPAGAPPKEPPARPVIRRGSTSRPRGRVWPAVLLAVVGFGTAGVALTFIWSQLQKQRESADEGQVAQAPPASKRPSTKRKGKEQSPAPEVNPNREILPKPQDDPPEQVTPEKLPGPASEPEPKQKESPKAVVKTAEKTEPEPKEKRPPEALPERKPEPRPKAAEPALSVLVRSFSGHTGPVTGLAFSPEGEQIVSGGKDATVRLWRLDGDKERFRFKHFSLGPVTRVGFSDKGARILASSGPIPGPRGKHRWTIVKIETAAGAWGGSLLSDIDTAAYDARYLFSPDGKKILRVNPQGGQKSKLVLITSWVDNKFKEQRIFPAADIIAALATVSFDGSFLISAPGSDQIEHLCVWNLETRKIRSTTIPATEVKSLALSKDGLRVAEGLASGDVLVWDITTGEEAAHFKGHTGFVHSLAFSPDGRRVLSGGGDKVLRLWDIAGGKELLRYMGHKGAVTSLAFSPDGQLAVSGSEDGEVRVWRIPPSAKEDTRHIGKSPADTPKNKAADHVRSISGHTAAVTSMGFSPDGRLIVSGSKDASVRVWDLEKNEELFCYNQDLSPRTSAVFSEDGRIILVSSGPFAGKDNKKLCSVAKVEVPSGRRQSGLFWPDFFSPPSKSFFVLLATDGKHQLVVNWHKDPGAGEASQMQPWGWGTGKSENTRVLGKPGISIALGVISPDGQIALTAPAIERKEPLHVWNLKTREVQSLVMKSGKIRSIALSRDGLRAAGGCDDKVVRVVDITNQKELGCFKGHTGVIHAVAFSFDGQRVLSGSADKTLRLWDIASGKELRIFTGHKSAVTSLAFSPDGRLAVSGSEDGEIRVWRLPR
jgi:WD40 repeat protein/serine/threonine protein kinase